MHHPSAISLTQAYTRAITVRDHAPTVIIVLVFLMLREIAAITGVNFPGSSFYAVLALVFCAYHVYTLDRTDHLLLAAVGKELSDREPANDY